MYLNTVLPFVKGELKLTNSTCLFNIIWPEIHNINIVQELTVCLKENSPCISITNATQGNNRSLLWESYAIHITLQEEMFSS
jgi:hypothetical protein